MMTKWLPNTISKLPLFCRTFTSTRSAVIDMKTEEILIIKEKYSSTENHFWKLSGGSIDPFEDIPRASEREVFEETGIRAKYLGLLGIRHFYPGVFKQEDMTFISVLEPITKETHMDKEELSDCMWLSLSEFYKLNIRKSDEPFKSMIENYMKNKNVIQKEEMTMDDKKYYYYKI